MESKYPGPYFILHLDTYGGQKKQDKKWSMESNSPGRYFMLHLNI